MGKVSIDKSLIKEITKILKDNDLSEITIKQGFSSITVARNISGFVSTGFPKCDFRCPQTFGLRSLWQPLWEAI